MKTTITIENKTFNAIPDFYEDDVGGALTFVIRQLDDTLVDITGAIILFKVKQINISTNQINSACSLTIPDEGECEYTFLSGDLDTEGVFDAELQITLGSEVNTINLGRFK